MSNPTPIEDGYGYSAKDKADVNDYITLIRKAVENNIPMTIVVTTVATDMKPQSACFGAGPPSEVSECFGCSVSAIEETVKKGLSTLPADYRIVCQALYNEAYSDSRDSTFVTRKAGAQ